MSTSQLSARAGGGSTRLLVGLAAILAVVGSPAVIAAEEGEPASSWYATGGAGVWVGDGAGWHGMALAHWRWRAAEEAWGLDLSFNTDTLRLQGRAPSPMTDVELYGELAGEYPFAGLLPDYYRRGRRLPGRGFRAGYGLAKVGLAYERKPNLVRFEVGLRRWFFSRSPTTDPDLVLPPATWAVEPRLHYAFWDVESDSSQWEPHQLFQRVRGVAWGVTLGAEVRTARRAWGARGGSFSPRDPRNEPGSPIVTIRQWLVGGVEVSSEFRLQWREEFRWGIGEDDLSRDRLGGLNPYVIRIGGLPWAGLVSGRYIAGHLDARFTGWADHEFGAFVDAAAVSDPRRVGESSVLGGAGGMGLFADLRFGDWKADARIGTPLPAAWLARSPALGAWVSVGRKW